MIPRISSQLNIRDYLGAFRVRWGIRRDRYRVAPGLYAVGTPNEYSDVLVTANYKLTFDIVRKNLNGLNAWLLVLDTKGVNVWCSAGKGTFGTKEIVHRIQVTSLGTIVKHKRLLLPQLGATGVAAHLVKESSSFTVIYGPVRASDIQPFIKAGYKAIKEMRRVNFGWYDRLKLIPNDIIYNLRYLLSMLIVISVLSGINTNGYSIQQALRNIIPIAKIIAAGYIAGIVFTPLLLPYIPTQNFSFKGLIMGIIVSVLLLVNNSLGINIIEGLAGIFFISSISSFLAMNFTGASTYTSLAGVKKEMKIAVPVQIIFAALALILFVLEITI
ncbi:MAG: mercury methylation corrinoid protein HgcA [Bacteroidota bacterium]